MSMSSLSNMFEFMSLIGQLKRVPRTGWGLHGVTDPESVADHMYRMAVLAFMAGEDNSGLNKNRPGLLGTRTLRSKEIGASDRKQVIHPADISGCIQLALVHDMAESIVGDLIALDDKSKQEKHAKEEAAMKHIRTLVSEDVGNDLFGLWEEYEVGASPEALYIKDLDKFDMILQAYEYEQLERKPGSLQEFFDGTKGKFNTTQVKQWVNELETMRSKTDDKND